MDAKPRFHFFGGQNDAFRQQIHDTVNAVLGWGTWEEAAWTYAKDKSEARFSAGTTHAVILYELIGHILHDAVKLAAKTQGIPLVELSRKRAIAAQQFARFNLVAGGPTDKPPCRALGDEPAAAVAAQQWRDAYEGKRRRTVYYEPVSPTVGVPVEPAPEPAGEPAPPPSLPTPEVVMPSKTPPMSWHDALKLFSSEVIPLIEKKGGFLTVARMLGMNKDVGGYDLRVGLDVDNLRNKKKSLGLERLKRLAEVVGLKADCSAIWEAKEAETQRVAAQRADRMRKMQAEAARTARTRVSATHADHAAAMLLCPVGEEELGLSRRTFNCLRRENIQVWGKLTEKTEEDLLKIRNFGCKSLKEVQRVLKRKGLALKGAVVGETSAEPVVEPVAATMTHGSPKMLTWDQVSERFGAFTALKPGEARTVTVYCIGAVTVRGRDVAIYNYEVK